MRKLALILWSLLVLEFAVVIPLAILAGDLGPIDKDMAGVKAWARNDFQNDTVIRVYKRDSTLAVPPLAVWTNAHVDVPRPSMTVTQVVHYCRLQGYITSWTTDKQGNRTSSTTKSGGPYTWVYRVWTGAYIGVGNRHGGLVWAEMPGDYVDEYTVATSRWAAAQSATETVSWCQILSETVATNQLEALDPVTSRWYSSLPAFLGVQDATAHSLPCTFDNLDWLPSTNHTFKISTGFDGYVHMSYNSESNTVTFTRLYEGVLPYDQTH